MENLINQKANEIFNTEITIIKRLMGGRSNYMYLIEANSKKYTFRVPGKNSEVFANRDIENENINIVDHLNINNKTIYFDKDGYKISEYVEGTSLSTLNVDEHLQNVSTLLKKVHNSNIKACNDYNPLKRLEIYENLNKGNEIQKYFTVKEEFLKYWEFLNNHKKVLCHGDSQTDNIILDFNNKLYLLDWEFCGNNDLFYDLACFGDKDFNDALKLLKVYFNNNETNEHYKRLYLWRTFQCLQWHNVALYKDSIGLSKELEVPFLEIAIEYITKANNYLQQSKKY